MGDGPPGFRRNSSCSAVLRILLGASQILSTGLLPFLADLSRSFDYLTGLPYRSPTTPRGKPLGLGFSRFARRYSGNRFFFLFLQLLRCFSSLRLPSLTLTVNDNTSRYWVPPFGYLRIIAYLLLPEAFRGSSRPSSASSAKAFTMRPFLLDLFQVEFLSLLGRSSICFFDCLGFLLLIIFSFQCTNS